MSTERKTQGKRNGTVGEHSLAFAIRDSANQIWLAGLGAYARAEDEGSKLFDSLVALGERVESRARDQVFRPIRVAEAKATEVRQSAGGALARLQTVFERRVAKVLNGLQIPTSRDVDELTQRVEELTVALERMERRAAARRSPAKPSARKRRTKPAASAGKTTTRTGSTKGRSAGHKATALTGAGEARA